MCRAHIFSGVLFFGGQKIQYFVSLCAKKQRPTVRPKKTSTIIATGDNTHIISTVSHSVIGQIITTIFRLHSSTIVFSFSISFLLARSSHSTLQSLQCKMDLCRCHIFRHCTFILMYKMWNPNIYYKRTNERTYIASLDLVEKHLLHRETFFNFCHVLFSVFI